MAGSRIRKCGGRIYRVALTRFPTVVNGPKSRWYLLSRSRADVSEWDDIQVLFDQLSRLFSENRKGTSGRSAWARTSSRDNFVGAVSLATPGSIADTE